MHTSSPRVLTIRHEEWALARPFVISRGAKTAAHVVVATVSQNGFTGRGEAVPYARYGETVDGVVSALEGYSGKLERAQVNQTLAAGAARNALDCALWDLEAKLAGVSVFELAGVVAPEPVVTAFTISLGSADDMADQARAANGLGLLKLKLGGSMEDVARMRSVREARPDARLIADANEAWGSCDLDVLFECAGSLGFEVIEQPLPAGADDALVDFKSPVDVCADESVHTLSDLTKLVGRYSAVNIKLDKCGGLSEALLTVARAKELGFKVMVGSMVATSLAVAPALLLASEATWVDLDGPLLLKTDRPFGLDVETGRIFPADPKLWG